MRFATYLILTSILAAALGCSQAGLPSAPGVDQPRVPAASHQLWAAVDFTWDGVSDELTVVPDRTLAAHYNITHFIVAGYLKLKIVSWDPLSRIMVIDATITNPFALTGYDVRGILYNLGEKELLNADDYTKIFDPNSPQVANPFRAYAKDEPNRKFWNKYSDPVHHIKTESFQIYFPGTIGASFMITASYPDNCAEPYDIVSIGQTGEIDEMGGSIDVTLEVLDWQDVTADHVIIESNPVTGSDVWMSKIDQTHWQATISNTGEAPVGEYEVWVAAWDEVDLNALYNKFTITVEPFINVPPVIDSGVDGDSSPLPDSIETYTVTAHDDDGDPLTFSWTVTDDSATVVLDVPDDTTGSLDVDWGALNALPGDTFDIDCSVSDGYGPPVAADTLHVVIRMPGQWSDPILVSGEAGFDETLPRIVLRETGWWIIYTDGSSALARQSTDGGYTWSGPMTIGSFADIDTLHAVLGGDNGIYVQYQRSDTKSTYVASYHGGVWSSPSSTSPGMGISSPPYSCDLGIASDGYVYSLVGDYFSMFGWRSNNPWDTGSWTGGIIQGFYDAIYSINDGFVQQALEPRWSFVHGGTELDYGWYGADWNNGVAMTGAKTLIEPAIALESDGPYHGVVAIDQGGTYDVQYFRFASWPPSSPDTVALVTGLTTVPVFHSISADGDTVSVLFDADDEVRYVESGNGGDTFEAAEVLGGGGGGRCAFSHVRIDPYGTSTVAAYAKLEDGDYNIYVRIKN